jgi:hypothetical protein
MRARAVSSLQRQAALSRWENEGGSRLPQPKKPAQQQDNHSAAIHHHDTARCLPIKTAADNLEPLSALGLTCVAKQVRASMSGLTADAETLG